MSTSQLKILSLPATLATSPGVLSPVVIYDSTHAILFDTGLPGMANAIKTALEEIGVPLPRLTHIAITHSDTDHIGCVAQLQADAPQKIEVLCHAAEKKYVQCSEPPLRLAQMEAGLSGLPEEHRPRMTALVEGLRANYWRFKAIVDRTVDDGDLLPCGVETIATPGHTPTSASITARAGRWLPEHHHSSIKCKIK
jgi:glyoxylase-like metal-dependent hydrolase (beta-lactamase superfamily II)